MMKIKKWKPVILSAICFLSIIFIMLAIINHYKINSKLNNEINNKLNNKTGYYIVQHTFFLDKIYISTKQENAMNLKITEIKETKKAIIIETTSGAQTCNTGAIGMCEPDAPYYKKTSKYINIPWNKKVIVLDFFGSKMKEYK